MSNNYVNDSADKAAKKSCEFPLNRTYITTISSGSANTKNLSFVCPYNWVSSRSPNKCIGLRECKVIPPAGSFSFKYLFEWIEDEQPHGYSIPFSFKVGITATMEQIIHAIEKAINKEIQKDEEIKDKISFDISYNDNTIKMSIIHIDKIKISSYFGVGYIELGNLFGLSADESTKILNTITDEPITINNVWNRKQLIIHSSISDDNNQILCENNYKYSPKKYLFPCNQQSISLWFSADGTTPINVNNSQLILKLSFIYNFKTAAI